MNRRVQRRDNESLKNKDSQHASYGDLYPKDVVQHVADRYRKSEDRVAVSVGWVHDAVVFGTRQGHDDKEKREQSKSTFENHCVIADPAHLRLA